MIRLLATASCLVLALGIPAAAGPGGARPDPAAALFCPDRSVAVGAVVIRAGRCYRTAVLRTERGVSLLFLQPGVWIPPGQLVRMNTPAGPKLQGRVFYTVPLQLGQPVVARTPIGTIQQVNVQLVIAPTGVVLVIVGPTIPSVRLSGSPCLNDQPDACPPERDR
ncbi:MAG: hypothetical protein QN163_07080 [Armatimonadota bacterium]|nr:hypothetical protein [Armatimonadota bacterium]MDR5696465.1 hypothetical protein [Armatimonadota bacterium]